LTGIPWAEIMDMSLEQLELVLRAATRAQRSAAATAGAAMAAAQAGKAAWTSFIRSLKLED
jgi:hypothetical protein